MNSFLVTPWGLKNFPTSRGEEEYGGQFIYTIFYNNNVLFSFERHFAPTLSTSIAHTTGWMPVESVVRYGRLEIPTIFYYYGMLLLRWFLNGRGFLKSRKI